MRTPLRSGRLAPLVLCAALHAPGVWALPTTGSTATTTTLTPHPQGCAASQEPAALAQADAPGAALQARIDSVLPTPAEERFLSVPWRTNLMAARREAQGAGKPVFLWIMVGNPQGCT